MTFRPNLNFPTGRIGTSISVSGSLTVTEQPDEVTATGTVTAPSARVVNDERTREYAADDGLAYVEIEHRDGSGALTDYDRIIISHPQNR